MATKENKPVRKAIKPLEPPAKRRKLSPPPVADAPVATPEPSQPPATQAESQPQPHTLSQPSLSQPSSQQKSSFADVLARLKETASEGRGTWVILAVVPPCSLSSKTMYTRTSLQYLVPLLMSRSELSLTGLLTNIEAEGGANSWARPEPPQLNPAEDSLCTSSLYHLQQHISFFAQNSAPTN